LAALAHYVGQWHLPEKIREWQRNDTNAARVFQYRPG
jgi:hypothetical protein